MTPAIAQALTNVERRGEDLKLLYTGGAEPNYADALRDTRPEPSPSAMSVVLPNDAYLVAGDERRPSYTKDGTLSVRDGVLVSSDGTPVLGFPRDDASGVPRTLRMEKNDVLLARADDLRVESDGVFSYARKAIDPRTLETSVERVVVGRVALARFPGGSALQRIDGTHVRTPQGIVPVVGSPNDGTFSPLMPQQRAVGRIDADSAISRLQDAYLALRALGAVERTQNGLVHEALDLVK